MYRNIEKELENWRKNKDHLPLILRGARQVGKSYIIEKFGRKYFKSITIVDFEFEPKFCDCFETFDPRAIVNKLELMTNTSIIEGETLLFLDEIQQCPKAILALRYFKEKMPNLHVIAAGSLLEFVLNETDFSFPVGRIQFMYLRPLSFKEFLFNLGENKILEFLNHLQINDSIDSNLHEKILNFLRQYLLIGGMPAIIQKFLKTNSLNECRRVQLALIQTYQNDFGKYASKAQYKILQLLFEKAPGLVAKHFKYVNVASHMRSREIKIALDQLAHAGLIYRVFSSSASGIPLEAQVKDNKFKLLFLDIGLMQTAHKINIQEIWNLDILQIHSGRLAEQFVGQELLAYNDCYENRQLYFWKRDKKSSSAEVDYVMSFDSLIIPIEVKAGKIGSLRSLKLFLKEKKGSIGIKISESPFSFKDGILSVPLYLIEHIPRLLLSILEKEKRGNNAP